MSRKRFRNTSSRRAEIDGSASLAYYSSIKCPSWPLVTRTEGPHPRANGMNPHVSGRWKERPAPKPPLLLPRCWLSLIFSRPLDDEQRHILAGSSLDLGSLISPHCLNEAQRAARFSSEQDASTAYEQAQAAIFRGPPNDLSTYRLTLDPELEQVFHLLKYSSTQGRVR
jgi:hypothetical protein